MGEIYSGIIDELPADEAARKNVNVDVLSLARAMQSEESGIVPRAAVGYCVKRHAARIGISITKLVTTTSKKPDGSIMCPEARGHYSRQSYAKYCSTFQAPTADTLEQAQRVIDGSEQDPSQGAELWDNPTLQTALAIAHPFDPDTHKGYHTADEIAQEREARGYSPVAVEGTSTRFWVKS